MKVSDSSKPQQQQENRGQTDAPGTHQSPQPSVPGANNSEATLLTPDWRIVYIAQMANSTTKAMSIQTRHNNAIQMIGEPNEQEKSWMRLVWSLVNRRDKNNLRPGERFADELARLEAMPLTERDAA